MLQENIMSQVRACKHARSTSVTLILYRLKIPSKYESDFTPPATAITHGSKYAERIVQLVYGMWFDLRTSN